MTAARTVGLGAVVRVGDRVKRCADIDPAGERAGRVALRNGELGVEWDSGCFSTYDVPEWWADLLRDVDPPPPETEALARLRRARASLEELGKFIVASTAEDRETAMLAILARERAVERKDCAKAASSVYEEHLAGNHLASTLSTPRSVLDVAVALILARESS